MEIDFNSIATLLFGSTSVVGFLFGYRSRKKLARVEADKAETDMYRSQVKDVLEMYGTLLTRLSEANRTIDTHIDRNRELSDRIWKAEQECNRLNERNHTQGERITNLLLEVEHWKHWHCRRCDCLDPRGREPSQDPPETVYLPFRAPEDSPLPNPIEKF